MDTFTALVCTAAALLSLTNGGMAVAVVPSAEEIQATFNAADKDGNGKLSVEELKEVMPILNEGPMSEDDLNMFTPVLMSVADEDGDGMISYDELTNVMLNEPDKEKMARAIFSIADTDGDGKVTKTEVAKMMKLLEADDDADSDLLDMMFMMADQYGDGKLSFQECYPFITWMFNLLN